MIVEIGHYALVLALATAIVLSLVPAIGARRGDVAMMDVAPLGSVLLFALVAFSFGVLTYAHVVSDFSVQNVWENSHSLVPLIYKYSGVWGNHEGSMMLWLLILSLYSALVALFGRNLPDTLKANVLSVQAWISVAFILFILLTSNPFLRLDPAPAEGRDLNPVLQDVGLAIHPPLLYLGYVGFSVCFSFAVAALLDGRIDEGNVGSQADFGLHQRRCDRINGGVHRFRQGGGVVDRTKGIAKSALGRLDHRLAHDHAVRARPFRPRPLLLHRLGVVAQVCELHL